MQNSGIRTNDKAANVLAQTCGNGFGNGNESERRPTVLLVEDEVFVREVTRDILQAAGYSVLESRTAADAKRVVGPNAADVQLLLTDVVLPDQSGLDLARDLLSICPQLKVVFISGYPENIITSSGLARRGVCYLPKPYSADSLMETIRQVMDEHQPSTVGQMKAKHASTTS